MYLYISRALQYTLIIGTSFVGSLYDTLLSSGISHDDTVEHRFSLWLEHIS